MCPASRFLPRTSVDLAVILRLLHSRTFAPKDSLTWSTLSTSSAQRGQMHCIGKCLVACRGEAMSGTLMFFSRFLSTPTVSKTPSFTAHNRFTMDLKGLRNLSFRGSSALSGYLFYSGRCAILARSLRRQSSQRCASRVVSVARLVQRVAALYSGDTKQVDSCV